MSEITGATRLFGIIGDPVAQVKTPQGLNAVMWERGVDGVLVPMHVAPTGLVAFMDGLRVLQNFGGLIATVPHKQSMVGVCDRVSERARLVGAVNAVRRTAEGRLEGEILDGAGFIEGLRRSGIDPSQASAFIAGAGGAAAAIAFALAEAGVARMTIFNRTEGSAANLKQRLAQVFPALPVALGTGDPAGHELIVNATSLGLRRDDPLPFRTDSLRPEMTVAEIIMEPATTALLARAEAAGCRVQRGLPMLHGQLALMADFLGMTK